MASTSSLHTTRTTTQSCRLLQSARLQSGPLTPPPTSDGTPGLGFCLGSDGFSLEAPSPLAIRRPAPVGNTSCLILCLAPLGRTLCTRSPAKIHIWAVDRQAAPEVNGQLLRQACHRLRRSTAPLQSILLLFLGLAQLRPMAFTAETCLQWCLEATKFTRRAHTAWCTNRAPKSSGASAG